MEGITIEGTHGWGLRMRLFMDEGNANDGLYGEFEMCLSVHVIQVVFVLNDCILVLLEICRVSSTMHIHFCCLSRLYYIMFTTLLFFFLYVCVP